MHPDVQRLGPNVDIRQLASLGYDVDATRRLAIISPLARVTIDRCLARSLHRSVSCPGRTLLIDSLVGRPILAVGNLERMRLHRRL
jgi:hypothetical protein